MWGSHGALRRSTERSGGEPGFKSPHIHRFFLYCSLIRKDISSQNGRMGSLLTNTAELTGNEYRQVLATKQKKDIPKDV